MSKWSGYPHVFIHAFSIVPSEQKVLPYMQFLDNLMTSPSLTLLTNVSTNKQMLPFVCHFAVCRGKVLYFGKI